MEHQPEAQVAGGRAEDGVARRHRQGCTAEGPTITAASRPAHNSGSVMLSGSN